MNPTQIKKYQSLLGALSTEETTNLEHWLGTARLQVIFSFPYLFVTLLWTHPDKLLDDKFLKILFCAYPNKAFINNIIQYLKGTEIDLSKLSKNDLFMNMIFTIKEPCMLSNFFLQDIFTPEAVFKHIYKKKSFIDIFSTSFYYLLNCEFPNTVAPSFKKTHQNATFKFPMDIDPREWLRPCIIIDVANEFQGIKNGKDFMTRENYLLTNIDDILKKLFLKNDDPRLMVLFIHQAYLPAGTNCPEIMDMINPQNRSGLKGTRSNPLDRIALYITVPCNIFTYPNPRVPGLFPPTRGDHGEKTTIVHPYQFNYDRKEPRYNNGEPYLLGRSKNPPFYSFQDVDSVVYDKYGRMRKVRETSRVGLPYNVGQNKSSRNIPHTFQSALDHRILTLNQDINHYQTYRDVESTDAFEPRSKVPGRASRPDRRPKMIQGSNHNQDYVMRGSACANAHTLKKNEIDDYMIAFLLLCHSKALKECSPSFFGPVSHKWILFSNDEYDWMKPSLKTNHVTHVRFMNFLDYISGSSPSIPTTMPNPNALKIITDLGLYPLPSFDQQVYNSLIRGILWMNSTSSSQSK